MSPSRTAPCPCPCSTPPLVSALVAVHDGRKRGAPVAHLTILVLATGQTKAAVGRGAER